MYIFCLMIRQKDAEFSLLLYEKYKKISQIQLIKTVQKHIALANTRFFILNKYIHISEYLS